MLLGRHVRDCPQCASRVQAMGALGAAACEFSCGELKPVAPGLEVAPVHGGGGLGEAVFYIRAAPGLNLPLQQPVALAEALVLEGSFEADGEVYGPGDFLSLEERPPERLVSDPIRGCVCLVTAHDPAGLLAD
jgi:hypothetical protein